MSVVQKMIGFGWGFLHGIQNPARTARELLTGRFEDDLAFVNDLDDGHASDFPTRMRSLSRGLRLPTVALTDRVWRTEVNGYSVGVVAAGGIYSHSEISFNRPVSHLDSIKESVDRRTLFTCRIEEAKGQYVLCYWRRIPVADMSFDELRQAIIDAVAVAAGVDDAIRQLARG